MFLRRNSKTDQEPSINAPDRRHIRVLIVEDSVTDAKLEGHALERYGIHDWKAVETAEQAVQELNRDQFNVALLDYNLPRMNGLALLELIKDKHPDTRVIVVTGMRDEQVAVAAMKLGADDYIAKDEFLTAGIIASLQNTLRSLENERKTRVAAVSSLEAGIIEVETILGLDDRPVGYDGAMGPQEIDRYRDEMEDMKQLILASDHVRTAAERQIEEDLIRRFVDAGSSPRDIIRLHHAALRSIRQDAARSATIRSPACAPTMVLAHLLQRVLEEFQYRVSMASLEGRAAA